MSDGITSQQILQLLASMLGGGLAGSGLTAFLNWRNSRRTAIAKENGAIAALAGEIRRSTLLCQHNAKLRALSTAPFIHFPIIAAVNVAFQERHSYPRLSTLQHELELYVLGITHVNEMIDLYHSMVPAVDAPGHHHLREDRDDLRNQIASICDGTLKLNEIAPESPLVLPTFIEHLSQSVENLRRA